MFEQLVESGTRPARPLGHSVVAVALHAGILVMSLGTGRGFTRDPGRPPTPITITYRIPVAALRANSPSRAPNAGLPTAPDAPTLPDSPLPLPAFDGQFAAPLAAPDLQRDLASAPGTDTAPPLRSWGATTAGSGPVADVAPALIGSPELRYPAVLRDSGLEGRVLLEFVVDTSGLPDSTTVTVTHADHAVFVAPAKEAVLGFRFRPGERDGHRVRVRVAQTLIYRIR